MEFNDQYSKWKGWNEGALQKDSALDSYFFEMLNLSSRFSNGLKVLEIGFGDADFLLFCQRNGVNAKGVEVNQTQVEKWQELLPVYNLLFLDETSEQYDIIILIDVLEHLSLDDGRDLLLKAKRVLSRGGVILCRFPNGDSPFGISNFNSDPTHITFYGSGLIDLLSHQCDLNFLYSGGDIYPVRFGPFYKRLANLFFLFLRNLLDIFFSLFLKKKPVLSYFSCNAIVVFSNSRS